MFNLNFKKKRLIFGDNESLFFVRLEKIKPKLKERKLYIKFREEYFLLLEKLLNSKIKQREIIKINKRLNYLKSYINKQEYNICIQNEENFLAEMCLSPNCCKNGFIEV